MSKLNSPCYGCNKRTVNCHGSCKKYGYYRHELIEYKHYIAKQDKASRKILSDMYWQSQASRERK